mmetsp:Transcript_47844/g.113687  ORF Transcript_47844/g.113687 Transcript_47844/m.113687 type:complete len:281 (+) Transcript_47844:62-904(+)
MADKSISFQSEGRRENEWHHVEGLLQSSSYRGPWCFIHMGWFTRWRRYVCEHRRKEPGPIPNEKLVSKITKANVALGGKLWPEKGLQTGLDYDAIPEEVWNYLQARYGGGPKISCGLSDAPKLENAYVEQDCDEEVEDTAPPVVRQRRPSTCSQGSAASCDSYASLSSAGTAEDTASPRSTKSGKWRSFLFFMKSTEQDKKGHGMAIKQWAEQGNSRINKKHQREHERGVLQGQAMATGVEALQGAAANANEKMQRAQACVTPPQEAAASPKVKIGKIIV